MNFYFTVSVSTGKMLIHIYKRSVPICLEVCLHIEVCLYIGRSVPIKRKVRVSSGTISDSDLGGAVKLGVTDV